MTRQTSPLIPNFSTPAGSCLNYADWQAAGITSIAYDLAALLMKPGLTVLESLADIHHGFCWPGEIVLNAAMLQPDTNGHFKIKSHYEGSIITLDQEKLWSLFGRLKPEIAILPAVNANDFVQYKQYLPPAAKLYAAHDAAPDINTGLYLSFALNDDFNGLLLKINNSERAVYLKGEFSDWQLAKLLTYNNLLIETNSPAQQGMAGTIYTASGLDNLLAADKTNKHLPLTDACLCIVCQQHLTQAYLHHLMQHVPLLAQRYLIQHNVYYCQNHYRFIYAR